MPTINGTSLLVIVALRVGARGRNLAVISLNCDYQSQKHQSATSMTRGLLNQAAVGAAAVPDKIESAFGGLKQGGG